MNVLTFEQLSAEHKEKAIKYATNALLESIVNHGYSCLDDELRATYDRVVEQCEQMRTPWFLAEYIMENEELNHFITENAKDWAAEEFYQLLGKDSLYILQRKAI